MRSRFAIATSMALREQRRRPLLLILLVIVPAYTVTRSIAITEATPRTVGLPGGLAVATTMRDVHGAVMAGIAIAFVAGLCGVFVMEAALQGDRRLVIAGFRPGQAIAARLVVLASATALVVAASLLVTAASFTPDSWVAFAAATGLIGLEYALIGALAGSVLDKLAATYLILFLGLTDLGIVQNPMFGSGTPPSWGVVLPGYGPSRVMIDAAFAGRFHATQELLLGGAWAAALGVLVTLALMRRVAQRR